MSRSGLPVSMAGEPSLVVISLANLDLDAGTLSDRVYPKRYVLAQFRQPRYRERLQRDCVLEQPAMAVLHRRGIDDVYCR